VLAIFTGFAIDLAVKLHEFHVRNRCGVVDFLLRLLAGSSDLVTE
jgi:hypothetical protein